MALFHYDKELGEVVPGPAVRASKPSSYYVQGEIEPYRAVCGDQEGQMITGRKQHREFKARNPQLIEVGTEKNHLMRNSMHIGQKIPE